MNPDEKPIKEQRVDASGIDWNHFTNQHEITFENDTPKKLVLTNWQQTSLYGQPAIRFDVTTEDEKQVKKTLTTKSKRLIRQLKPLIQKAFSEGKNDLKVIITRTGTGYDTNYKVEERP